MKDILKHKIGYFVSVKYTDIFCDLLRNIKEIIKILIIIKIKT